LLRLDILHGWIEVHPSTGCYAQLEWVVIGIHGLNLRRIVRVCMTIPIPIAVSIHMAIETVTVQIDVVGGVGRLPEIGLGLLLELSTVVCKSVVSIVGGEIVFRLVMLVLILILILIPLLLLLLLMLLVGGGGGGGWK
jgi:hypothetical protein